MYYKDPQNKIHSIESSQYEYLLPVGSVAISDEEAEAIRLAAIPVPPVKTQAELDYDRYIKRAQAKDKILAEFASENMARVRAGTWTVPNLIALTQDAQLTLLLANINTLSYELAIGSVQSVANPLITPEIKAGWIAKLQAHLYLVP